ncbi:MAG: ABC transporter permease [Calditrichaeota bacterium]|nr:MAG: ABC transporter permease [Calditrichota bacterium]
MIDLNTMSNSLLNFTLRSLKFYRRTHWGLMLGSAVSTAVLIGALVIGDSVKYSLKKIALERLGHTDYTVESGDRYFRALVASELAARLQTPIAALIKVRGLVVAPNGIERVNNVQILGVDEEFGRMCDEQELYRQLGSNEIFINERLARKINAQIGDELLLRIESVSNLPKDAPLSDTAELSVNRRFIIRKLIKNHQFGRFSLENSQVEPHTVFIERNALADLVQMSGRANVLLIGARREPLSAAAISHQLREIYTISDAGYSLTTTQNGSIELRSRRVFLDQFVVDSLISRFPQAQPIMTYFVNQLSTDERQTPYSFVTGSASPLIPSGLKDDEIILNRWTAEDLHAQIGDAITLSYFIVGPGRTLIENQRSFILRRIVPMNSFFTDRSLMPDFPGLAEEENCRDWEAGFPIDYDRIRDRDEQYWDDYRGAPKAFVTLHAAQEMWRNRFGALTALRFSPQTAPTGAELGKYLNPVAMGLNIRAVRQIALEASNESVDFSQLFLGLSFFLILAALLLTGMLFVFGARQRVQEIGLLQALGFPARKIKRLYLLESSIVAMAGGFCGLLLGLIYHQLVLTALKTIWKSIVGTSSLVVHLRASTLLIGVAGGVIMSVFAMWMTSRWLARRSPAELQKGNLTSPSLSRRSTVWSLLVALLCLTSAAASALFIRSGGGSSFFITGILLLAGGLALIHHLLYSARETPQNKAMSLIGISARNLFRRPLSSITVIGILAAAVFITFTVGTNRTNSVVNPRDRSSGTGGFAFWAETTLPLLYDLNSKEGAEHYQLDSLSALPFRVKDGDDASCLNLNRVQSPRLIATDPMELERRKAFSFIETSADFDRRHPWSNLEKHDDRDVVPGIADMTVIVWGLGKQIGDTLVYRDELGRDLRIRLVGGLANSIFQGNVIISEKRFLEHFPSTSGYRVLLVDPPQNEETRIDQDLTWALQDLGIEVTPTAERLADFNQVTNTYLTIFMILGGLALMIGSIGIGLLLQRNVAERRGELALMRAVGFNHNTLQKMVFIEHALLVAVGIGCGAAASLISSLFASGKSGAPVTLTLILFSLLAMVGSGWLWTLIAAKWSLTEELLSALRNE